MPERRPAVAEFSVGWELFILALTVLSLVNAVLLLLIRYAPTAQVVLIVEGAVGGVFLADFLARLLRSGNRRRYLLRELGWADLLSTAPFLRWLRLLRLPRLRQRIGDEGGIRGNAQVLMRTRAVTTLLVVLLLTIVVLELGSVLILAVEESAVDGNIKTASDALWFVIVSMSTVGYGDRFPVTNAGRVVGTMVLVTGIALFSTLTGFLAHFFFGRTEPAPGSTLRERRIQRLEERRAQKAPEEEGRTAPEDDPPAAD
jgi:voltage-gated potassium channel